MVEADKARITQVISNLLSNAIKHTKKKSSCNICYRSGPTIDGK
jgi:signal transduction histidine kinase